MQLKAAFPPWAFWTFCGIVVVSILLAFAALSIQEYLRRREVHDKRYPGSRVDGDIFWSKLRYVVEGPVAEFVIIFATIAFVAMVFWLAIYRQGLNQ
jgi:hypothetical protein